MYTSMLVDTRNALYRAIYAGLKEPDDNGILIFFKFMASYIRKFKPASVHFFWDEKKANVWRTKIYNEYKANRNLKEKEQIDSLLEKYTKIISELVTVCGCRSYFVPKQEADDLIYAFCRQNIGDKIIIVSSDGDFRQLVFSFRNVDLYNPMGKDGKLYAIEDVNPIELKCYMGEKSDNIPGYMGIGPVKSKKLITDVKFREKLFKDCGSRTYIRNKVLIDLSLCPYTLRNIKSIIKTMMEPVKYDTREIIRIIQKYKVKGMMGEISSSLLPFKALN